MKARACLFAGSPTDGLMGGGFLYTNKTTLSLGWFAVCII
ncbi:putative oxidoreductase FixC [Citrobacter koseri]|uniref:Putative oxidoreductase FixC n=1 Tax=Citrobacter koseri TaxID=545 RepID=A0A3S4ICI0_CITKO|nr:putative oxidoreductase FixC [Citrobacter koseri]